MENLEENLKPQFRISHININHKPNVLFPNPSK